MATKETTARLKNQYNADLVKQLHKDLKLDNVNQVPKIDKIMVSVGLGRGKDDKRLFEVAANTLRKITGQQPIETIARKSIASFKLREGNRIGLKVTLRGEAMYEFLDRMINIVIPRLRDFHGVPEKSFDASGNYNIGFVEQGVFPELSYEETTLSHGIQVTIVTNTQDATHAKALLSGFGMPFEKKESK